MGTNNQPHHLESLVLQYKTDKNRYVFNLSAKKKSVSRGYTDAVSLIESYPVRNRNCRIVRGRISLKAGHGQLPFQPVPDPVKPVKLYTKPRYLSEISPCIFSNDEEFHVTKYAKGFLERHRDTIYSVDKAIVVNYDRLKIETPYGIASIDDLSTGCKTLLNILYLMDSGIKGEALVNVDEAGNNVLRRILDLVAGSNISLYITHDTDCIDNRYSFILNGKELQDEMEFTDVIWEDDTEDG